MSDLVKRLRGLHHIRRDSTPLSCAIDLAQQAADEIERLTAALSAEPAQEMTDERICDLMGWNVEAMQQNEPEDLPTRVRALVRVAEAEAVAADRASRLPEMGAGDWPELPPPTHREEADDMSTDRELLEKAAKAAGLDVRWYQGDCLRVSDRCNGFAGKWNPLTDDGDALRLAVKLGMNLALVPGRAFAVAACGFDVNGVPQVEVVEPHGDDALPATRRAIVRAAAAVAEQGVLGAA